MVFIQKSEKLRFSYFITPQILFCFIFIKDLIGIYYYDNWNLKEQRLLNYKRLYKMVNIYVKLFGNSMYYENQEKR